MWRKFKDTPRDKWKAKDGQQSFRVDTDGQGHERPALYRYVKEIELTSPSKWGRAAACRKEGEQHWVPTQAVCSSRCLQRTI